MSLDVVCFEALFEAGPLGDVSDPLADNFAPLAARFPGEHLNSGVGELGDVKKRPGAVSGGVSLVWCAGEACGPKQFEQQPSVVLDDEPSERIVDEFACDALAQRISDGWLAGLGVGAEPLPGVFLG